MDNLLNKGQWSRECPACGDIHSEITLLCDACFDENLQGSPQPDTYTQHSLDAAKVAYVVARNAGLFMRDIEIPNFQRARAHFINKAICELGHSSVVVAEAFDAAIDAMEREEYEREMRASEMAVRNSQFSSIL